MLSAKNSAGKFHSRRFDGGRIDLHKLAQRVMVHDGKVQCAEAGERGSSDFIGAMEPSLGWCREMARYRDAVLLAQGCSQKNADGRPPI